MNGGIGIVGAWDGFNGFLVFTFATFYCLYFGSVGYIPMDHPTIFDCGWRIYSGQVPWREFSTPTGVTAGYMQAFFFWLFGVNWLSFCLHASLLNGTFCALAYSLLRRAQCARLLALISASLTGILFYAPYGVPNMDQHAFFFCFLAVYCQITAPQIRNEKVQKGLLVLVVICLYLAAFSKHLPTVFFLPFFAGLWFLTRKEYRFSSFRWLLASTVLCGLILFVFFWVQGAAWFRFVYYTFNLPLWTAENRSGQPGNTWHLVSSLLRGYNVTLWAFGVAVLALLLSAIARLRKTNFRGCPPIQNAQIVLWFAVTALYLSSWGAVLMSKNQKENFIPFMFLIPALTLASCLPFYRHFLHQAPTALARRLLRLVALALYAFLLVWLGVRGWKANFVIGVKRICHDNDSIRSWADFQKIPRLQGNLWPMGWFGPGDLPTLPDFEQMRKFCQDSPGPFLLFSENSVFYGLSGRPSLMPNLVFNHPAYFPREKDTFYWNDLEETALAQITKVRPLYVIRDSDDEYLPKLTKIRAWIEARRMREFDLGSFKVTELRRDP